MKIQLFNVEPAVPPELQFLETLSYNMWWCWNSEAIELFRRINPQLWRECGHNPRDLLSRVPQGRFEMLAQDEGYLSHQKLVMEKFRASVTDACAAKKEKLASGCTAYFSLEYGIHESIRTYSGGLGVLASDHLKAAADLNLPLVAVGLMYRQGYFQQYLNTEGWQQEHYPENDIHRLPVQKACDANGKQIEISIPLPEGNLRAIVWRIDLGSIPIYLLDANISENSSDFRSVTAQLYGGDRRTRLRQELLLGIGGFRALLALGHDPHVCHANEGHAAFLSLARIAHLVQNHGVDLKSAMEIVPRTSVFTTHTPVPAGNETFHADLVRPHFEALRKDIGIDPAQIIAWSQGPAGSGHGEISMTILGLRMAQRSNAVSGLHGELARKMWAHLWPGRPTDEVPIHHITNGIHVPSWLATECGVLFERYLGPNWRAHPGSEHILRGVLQIPDEELWRAHEIGRSRLIRGAREMLERQLRMRNAPRSEIAQAKAVLDHDALTIGFARRFATYKRGTLLLRDQERLEALLSDQERPVQFLFAGKAHPADDSGKDFIRQIVRFANRANVRRHMIFLENYDMNMARYLVQGVDVWLNTPRRPQEASGTSGMKAAVNGALNISVLDGWWCEGYSKDCGWAIGHGEEYDDNEYQDTVESQALFNLLENEAIPMFFDRPSGDVPRGWVRMMKNSIRMALSFFTTHRMVREYQTEFYDPAAKDYEALMADNAARARQLVAQHTRLEKLWNKVRVVSASSVRDTTDLHVGASFKVTATVTLGDLKPEEVDVEVYYGPVASTNVITSSHVEKMRLEKDAGGGVYEYEHQITCRASGRYGFTMRVTPLGRDWKCETPGFITWADAD